ncbi:PAS domain-containing sensor histidine kinase [Oscillatoria acuminata]|uniref:histidine kinase n=1 Tax=Oscillatoria acuminata PCC 6304 TaxID=56110 RepID=K9TMN0_9CYAN|nr:PAS domain-containing sensor histidine kinase [Oscillatoria acuminata]AFY83780.1 PAS domain S-box [Oscillatoria acuminata PCC 6304]
MMKILAFDLPDSPGSQLQPIVLKYSSFLDTAAVGIFQITPTGSYLRANRTLARIYGYESAASLMAGVKNMGNQLYVEQKRYEQLMQVLRTQRDVENFESRVYRQDGSIAWVRDTIRIMRDRTGQVIGYQGIVEPMEEPLSDRLSSPEDLEPENLRTPLTPNFVSMLSHELRGSLTVIAAANDLLKLHSQKMTPEQRLKYFQKIDETVKHTNNIIEGFLTLGKAECGGLHIQSVPVYFASLCEDVWQDVEKLTDVTHRMILTTTGDSEPLMTDPTLLRQIILNLLVNAVKYSPQGSSIYCDFTFAEGEIIFRIKDRGIGIPPEDRANLFTLFHRAKNVAANAGSGLGLAIVKRSVDLLGGKIWVESTVGEGTTFTVTLPKLPRLSSKIDDYHSISA